MRGKTISLSSCAAIAALSWLACLPTGAHADSIGISFVGLGGAGATMSAGDSAGVTGVAQQNWNNVTGGTNGSLSNLVDSTGATTSASVSYTAGGVGVQDPIGSPGDVIMKSGLITANATSNSTTVSNIPYSQYSVYAYIGNGSAGNQGLVGHLSIAGFADVYFVQNSLILDSSGAGVPTNYTLATGTSVGTANSANYAVFTGLTGSSFTISQIRDGVSGNLGLNGMQIINAVPEPSTCVMALAGIACGGWHISRRRKRA
jgi:hypothetical protein